MMYCLFLQQKPAYEMRISDWSSDVCSSDLLLWAGAGAFCWLIGDAAGVALARHLGLIVMLQGAVIGVLGPQISRALAFPLFYALFMVPFGEEFVPILQTITAQLSMLFLGWATEIGRAHV